MKEKIKKMENGHLGANMTIIWRTPNFLGYRMVRGKDFLEQQKMRLFEPKKPDFGRKCKCSISKIEDAKILFDTAPGAARDYDFFSKFFSQLFYILFLMTRNPDSSLFAVLS